MLNIKTPVITQLIEDQIHYLREELPELKDPYDILDHMVTFQYRDEDLDWIYKSTENMNNFVLAWILGEWEVKES